MMQQKMVVLCLLETQKSGMEQSQEGWFHKWEKRGRKQLCAVSVDLMVRYLFPLSAEERHINS